MSDLKQLIRSDAALREIQSALPEHCNADRFRRAVLTALNKTPKLLNCTQASFTNAMMNCSELGLEPNGREAHLIPYGNQCQLIVDYKGLIKLAYQSRTISSIYANCVYEGDEFDYATCDHIPHGWRIDTDDKPDDRGKMIGAFVVIHNKDGSVHRERMTFDEIEAIRKRSKAGSSGPWKTDFDEMAKKTVFRRASKWIQLSPHVERAMEFDYDSLPPINTKARVETVDASVLLADVSPDNEPPLLDDDTDAATYPDAD